MKLKKVLPIIFIQTDMVFTLFAFFAYATTPFPFISFFFTFSGFLIIVILSAYMG